MKNDEHNYHEMTFLQALDMIKEIILKYLQVYF